MSTDIPTDATTPSPSPRPRRRLVVLAGPTAVGKGAVSSYIREHHPEVWLSVSATTRPPRPGEVDGQHYHFLDADTFSSMVEAGEFLEYAVVHGRNWYGTPRRAVEERLDENRPVLLEIDLAGARQVRQSMPDALFVFLAPPSWDELVRRLVGRGTEDEDERARRLATAKIELAAQDEFDVTVVNDEVRRAAEELVSLMDGAVPPLHHGLPGVSRRDGTAAP
ncbi:guanylate kinase [Mobilicoccus pelagius]|uniref:Guanylate kinase n=1 Tax=Mobilicoccus pelagius NBRC 104925 TaxID=1089455 RepID=H5UV08_9MICO|nr:guanylate kinase [Mobilicoccus pelagius]GAB49566.1 guanylate kinase [Mobilicoccus pelagius NBRC 104925]